MHSVNVAGLEALRGLPITKLRLSGCPLILDAPLGGPLRGLPITDLTLGDTNWSSYRADAPFKCLAALPLTRLNLGYRTELSDSGLARLQRLPLLKNLEVADYSQLSEEGIASLKGDAPPLEISDCHIGRFFGRVREIWVFVVILLIPVFISIVLSRRFSD